MTTDLIEPETPETSDTDAQASTKAPARGLGSARLIALVVALVVAGLVVVLATGDKSGDTFGTSPLLGKKAPEIQGTDVLKGTPVSLSQLQSVGIASSTGQRPYVFVNFFGSWCPPCQVEHPELKAFSEEHTKTGDAALLAVAYQDTPSEIKKFFSTRGGDWPVINSDRSAVDWGVLKAPETYLVDPLGYVIAKVNGGVTKDGLDRMLEEAKAAEASAAGSK